METKAKTSEHHAAAATHLTTAAAHHREAAKSIEAGKPETGELYDYINKISPQRTIKSGREETGISIKPISVSGSERIIRWAFEYACRNGRRKVACIRRNCQTR